MRSLSFSQVASFLHTECSSQELMKRVIIDSREASAGTLFFALPGEHTDGHQFVEDVLKQGGFAVVKTGYGSGDRVIEVADPLEGLQRLAKQYLALFSVPVVAVTGSNGKTTTKDMIAAILSEKWSVHKTQGNFNNEIGLPLTVLGLDESHQILILEMGMRGLGQIFQLTQIAPPDIAVITNIGPVHLELLKTQKNIQHAKGEILTGLKPNGMAVLNGDDPLVRELGENSEHLVLYYGMRQACGLYASDIILDSLGRASFTCHYQQRTLPVSLPIPGVHNINNALAAMGVGLRFGLSIDQCIKGLRSVIVSKMRMQLTEGQKKIRIINDVYNASPASMKAALDTLSSIETGKRRIAILGDMRELGELTQQAHIDIGNYAARKCDHLVCIGQYRNYLQEGARLAGFCDSNIGVYECIEDFLDQIWQHIEPKDLVLIKASRGVALERVVDVLER